MGLMAAMYHLNMNFPNKYEGKLLEPIPIKSLRAYNELSLINKLTCIILPEQDWVKGGWYEQDREAAQKNQIDLHTQLAGWCKLMFLNHEKHLLSTKQERDPNPPTLFMHYFAKTNPVAAPLPYDENDQRSDKIDKGSSQNHQKAWENGKYNFFAGEWGFNNLLNNPKTKAELENTHPTRDKQYTNTQGIINGDNYVQSLMDYVRFVFISLKYGFRGAPAEITYKTPQDPNPVTVERRTSIVNVEKKGVI